MNIKKVESSENDRKVCIFHSIQQNIREFKKTEAYIATIITDRHIFLIKYKYFI